MAVDIKEAMIEPEDEALSAEQQASSVKRNVRELRDDELDRVPPVTLYRLDEASGEYWRAVKVPQRKSPGGQGDGGAYYLRKRNSAGQAIFRRQPTCQPPAPSHKCRFCSKRFIDQLNATTHEMKRHKTAFAAAQQSANDSRVAALEAQMQALMAMLVEQRGGGKK